MYGINHRGVLAYINNASRSNKVNSWRRYIVSFPSIVSATVLIAAFLAIAGWAFNIGIFTSVIPDLPTMKPLTAIMLAGLAVALHLSKPGYKEIYRVAAIVSICCVILLSSSFLITSGEARIITNIHWQEPSAATNFTLLMLALALFMILSADLNNHILVGLIIFTCVPSLHRLITFIIGHGTLQTDGPFNTMSLPTSLCLFLLSCGIFLSPMTPFPRQLIDNTLQGHILRHYLPWVIVMPTLLTVIIAVGINYDLYDSDFARVAIITFLTVVMASLLWMFTNRLQRIETYRTRAELVVRKREAYANQVIEGAPDAVVIINSDGIIERTNQRMEQIFGYKKEELLGENIERLVPMRFRGEHAKYIQKYVESPSVRFMGEGRELFARRKNGTDVAVEVALAPLGTENGYSVIATIVDITGRVNDQKAIKKALKEKTLLLNEIHHRVKNNLQIVASFLSLQAGTVEDPKLAGLIRESESRVHSMALIHQVLYEHKDFSSIALDLYIQRLSKLLSEVYDASGRNIQVHVDSDDICVNLNSAIPLGLIVNELLCNAFKHAFPDNVGGEIWVELGKVSDTTARLIISDNGQGFSSEITVNGDNKQLGMQIVFLLAEQIGGHLEIVDGDHGKFVFTFDYLDTEN